ncbi:MAG: TatD family hydrolase [Clostridia bacterium]|nr:TatD family hydrolase [Clostridia bacterium]
MIFDAHAHYNDEQFDEDRHELLTKINQNGVAYIMNNGTDLETSLYSIKLSEKYPFIKAAVGFHPHECDKAGEGYIEQIANLCKNKNVRAIGEIGLDYYYDFTPKDLQLKIFEEQLILANELDMPVVVHDREAHGDTLALLKKHRPKGLLHCFSGSVEMLKEVIDLGMYISLGGAVTFKNAKKPLQSAIEVPLDRLTLETDAPYMTPVPFRGKRCNSEYITYTAAKIAEARGMSISELLEITYNNGCELFGLEK